MLIHVLPHAKDLPLPSYATPGSAGMDIRAAVPHTTVLLPGERTKIPTGLCFALDPSTVGYVHARSGRAFDEGLALPQGVAVLDADYRGELLIPLINLDPFRAITIQRGDRIAQLVIVPFITCTPTTVDALPPSERGEGGFGSTGRR